MEVCEENFENVFILDTYLGSTTRCIHALGWIIKGSLALVASKLVSTNTNRRNFEEASEQR